MAYPEHTLVTFGGTMTELAANDEIFQCGVRGIYTGGGPVPEGDLQDLADKVLNGVSGTGGGLSGIWAAANGFIANTAKLAWVKAVNIAPDGSYSSEPAISQITPLAGGTAPALPSFCCIALSWSTGKTLGKAVRGRLYPPNFGAPFSGGSFTTAAAVTSLLAWQKNLYIALNNALSPAAFIPHVVSKSGELNPITGCRVGNVIDTQRRRKDATPETYQTGPVS